MTPGELNELLKVLRKHGVTKYSGEASTGHPISLELTADPVAAVTSVTAKDILGEDYPKDILFASTPYAVPDDDGPKP